MAAALRTSASARWRRPSNKGRPLDPHEVRELLDVLRWGPNVELIQKDERECAKRAHPSVFLSSDAHMHQILFYSGRRSTVTEAAGKV